MELSKSSRHSKITGDFAEHLVLYWLSKYGFECAKVDHTGRVIEISCFGRKKESVCFCSAYQLVRMDFAKLARWIYPRAVAGTNKIFS